MIDYMSRFKSEKSVLLGIMGTRVLDGLTEKEGVFSCEFQKHSRKTNGVALHAR